MIRRVLMQSDDDATIRNKIIVIRAEEIKNCRFENCSVEIVSSQGGDLVIDNCHFQESPLVRM